MKTDSLREAGLTEGEIKVYLALTELGSSTTGPILEKCGIARSIIYLILEKLIQKGLVSYIIKDKTKYYQTTDPIKLLEYVEEREKRLEENKKEIENLLPQLRAKQIMSKTKEAQIFEGFKGIQTAHEFMYSKLKKGDEYFYLGIPAFQEEKYHLYWQRDHRRRIKEGIKCRLLFNKGTDQKILKNRNSFKGCNARYIPLDINTPAWILGYKDVIVIGLQSDKGIAIMIINQDIANSFKAYFEYFWIKSKPFKLQKS